ncbi:MAG: N-acetylmuramoyl-L-alanine amidase [Actinobacteria bacterium]|nr:N-acetylmuramoyl-L-alanine amidase [Actinomycetota bacterium]
MGTDSLVRSAGRSAVLSRRQLVQLVGSASLAAAALGACSNRPPTDAVSASSAAPLPSSPPAPVVSFPPAPSGVSAVMLCRDSWGASPPRHGGRPHTIVQMTIHHSAVTLEDNRVIADRLRQHQRYHQDGQGWIDIAYHVGVDRKGNIFELRTPELAGDTATDYDPSGHFLVLCEGDFDVEPVSDDQLHSAAVAFAWAAQTFRLGPHTLAGHRDFASTSCPGTNLYARVASGELKGRIEGLLAQGPVDLRTICGPKAAAIVESIEAGN